VRISQGIHFRLADVQARKQGRHVAQWVFSHFLRSVDDDDRDDGDEESDEVRGLPQAACPGLPETGDVESLAEIVRQIRGLPSLRTAERESLSSVAQRRSSILSMIRFSRIG